MRLRRETLSIRDRLLLLILMARELDATIGSSVIASKYYTDKMIYELKKEGLIKSLKANKIYSWYLTTEGKKYISERYPVTSEMYLPGYRRASDEADRVRLVRTSDVLLLMYASEVSILLNEKPPLFVSEKSNRNLRNELLFDQAHEPGAYYPVAEFKSRMGKEQQGSRLCGLYITKERGYLVYPISTNGMKWSAIVEERMCQNICSMFSEMEIQTGDNIRPDVIMIGDLKKQISEVLKPDTRKEKLVDLSRTPLYYDRFLRIYLLEASGIVSDCSLYLLREPAIRLDLWNAYCESYQFDLTAANLKQDGTYQGNPLLYIDIMESRKLAAIPILINQGGHIELWCYKEYQNILLEVLTEEQLEKITFHEIDLEQLVKVREKFDTMNCSPK